MSADDVEREFWRASYSEREAAKSSWVSFLEFAARVIRITLDILDALKHLFNILR
jgi:hypothetical protein